MYDTYFIYICEYLITILAVIIIVHQSSLKLIIFNLLQMRRFSQRKLHFIRNRKNQKLTEPGMKLNQYRKLIRMLFLFV